AGLPHRMVDALRGIDPGPLRAAGYEPATNVVMCHSGPPDRPADPAVRVEVVDLDTMVDKGRREWRAELTGAGDRAVEQLARRRESLLRGAPEVIFLGVREAGAVVAHADLYADPESGVAQLEDVQTDAAYRDRGLARALLADGLRRARSAGCDLVFLVAGADDWPRHLYARLGYADVGEIHEFTRAPTSLDGTGQLP
ncbi:MAG TPA: GNAT family N-acetyltransferase, partial [Rugosimonospora sp.]|nr:GNAT family N-acetyltransferase [Rugosimonospora sp.]